MNIALNRAPKFRNSNCLNSRTTQVIQIKLIVKKWKLLISLFVL